MKCFIAWKFCILSSFTMLVKTVIQGIPRKCNFRREQHCVLHMQTHAVLTTDLGSSQINCQTLFFFSCLCFQIFRDINIGKVDSVLHIRHRHCPDKQGILNNRMKSSKIVGILWQKFSLPYEKLMLINNHILQTNLFHYIKRNSSM